MLDYIIKGGPLMIPLMIESILAVGVFIDRALAFRAAADNNARFYDIDFRAMHNDPVAEVRGLYQWLGESVSEEFEIGMTRWWQENSENRDQDPHRDPSAYGVDINQVRTLFAEYSARMATWTDRRKAPHGN